LSILLRLKRINDLFSPDVRKMKQWRYALILVLLVGATFIADCRSNMAQTDSSSPKRDINAVLADNDKRLLAIPGVVGVYVGVLDDRQTSCLKVMLAEETPEAKRDIPRTIEGYLVVTEITGEIRPLGKP